MSIEREKEFLLKLADLCEEYKVSFEIYEDHISPIIVVDRLSIDPGYLGDSNCPNVLRKIANELK